MDDKKKELKNLYKQGHPQMGIYQILNLVNQRIFVGASSNLQGIFNRHKFQLEMGNHSNKVLQAEWKKFGSDKFAFEILDELTPTEGSSRDYREDLAFLEELWLEKLQPYGERGYNERKKGTEEMLRIIAENRLKRSHEPSTD